MYCPPTWRSAFSLTYLRVTFQDIVSIRIVFLCSDRNHTVLSGLTEYILGDFVRYTFWPENWENLGKIQCNVKLESHAVLSKIPERKTKIQACIFATCVCISQISRCIFKSCSISSKIRWPTAFWRILKASCLCGVKSRRRSFSSITDCLSLIRPWPKVFFWYFSLPLATIWQAVNASFRTFSSLPYSLKINPLHFTVVENGLSERSEL